MTDEVKQQEKSHKELRKEYTFNKLKGLGQMAYLLHIQKNRLKRGGFLSWQTNGS